jgi:hypothetical protein
MRALMRLIRAKMAGRLLVVTRINTASSLSTGAAHARVFRCPKGKKSRGVERGGHAVGPPLLIHWL